MKLKLKFISLSIISIVCIFFLGYSSYTNLLKYSKITEKFSNIDNLTTTYSNKIMSNSTIYTSVWHILYLNAKNDSIGVTNSINDFNNILSKENSESQSQKQFIDSAKNIILNLNSSNISNFVSTFEEYYKATENQMKDEFKQNVNLLTIAQRADIKDLATYRKGAIIVTIFSIFLISLVLLFSYVNIFNPLSKIISIMTGDNKNEIPFSDRNDEIGDIARALNLLNSTSIEKQNLEEKSKLQLKKSEEERHNSMLTLYNNFETKVKSIVDMVASAVEKMNSSSKTLEKLALSTRKETSSLASTSSEAKNNIEEMSRSTTEFNSSVNEINTQVTNSLEYARRAAEQADQVNNVVLDLDTKANAVTSIIDIINNITSQIDLLALNATIEAARAGEMGKGFAVVANEIKALATQTSKATEQINFQISGIQSSTNKAVASIQEITESVKTINKNSESITSAVKKQSETSTFISQGMNKVVSIFSTVNIGIEKVSDSSNQYGQTADIIVTTAEDLLKQSSTLQTEVDRFLSSLKLQ